MTKRHIIFIPGKNPKPPEIQHKSILWRTLLEGVRRAEPDVLENLSQHEDFFKLITWNYLYYKKTEDISREIPWIDELINQHGPSKEDIYEANGWHRKLDTLLYNTIDHIPSLLNLLPGNARSTAKELERYFQNEGKIASAVREQVKEQLRPILAHGGKVLLIGHSMGSVIAYDTLWALSNLEHLPGEVDLFLTMGSPLGLNYVQHRLMGHQYEGQKKYPSNIRHWVNISAVGDVISLDRTFSDDFAEMLNLGVVDYIEDHCDGIYNFYHNEKGLNPHRSYGYLVNPAVGKVIADWWLFSEQN